MFSIPVSADNWNKEKNELNSSLTFEHNSNLFNSQVKTADSSLRLAADYNLVKLFEGYGIQLPVNINRVTYQDNKQLNNTAYSVSPAARLFLSESSNLEFNVYKAETYSLPGQQANEFNQNAAIYKTDNQSASVGLKLGKAPQQAFLNSQLALTERSRDSIENNQAQKIRSAKLALTYGFKISEDTYFLSNLGFDDESRQQQDSQHGQLGLGFYTKAGGSHNLSFIIGKYQREQDNRQDGIYWQLQDNWQIAENIGLTLSSYQLSEVSYETNSLSQLRIQNSAGLTYIASNEHQLNIGLSHNKVELENDSQTSSQINLSLGWHWQLLDYFSVSSSIKTNQSKYDFANIDAKIDQTLASIRGHFSW
ncbi:hypothetical protein C2869_11485 [Saccharobesus litoralis]|uniref:Uncharacterized protein n=1 Tax=Saccharobesus litoralis TaxID=2172099 RepID=A0A2S0VS72_9ALTE|nr:hypothetical protein [Saccharobesus litoralis]AWB67022.1 hypothetical protein C2869_11485 [Saccharobesus litoralis]